MRHDGIIFKMVEMEIKDFSNKELNRVFKDCFAKRMCIRGARKMIATGLTLDEVYQEKQIEFSPSQQAKGKKHAAKANRNN